MKTTQFDADAVELAGLTIGVKIKRAATGLRDVTVTLSCGYFDENPTLEVQGWRQASPEEAAEIQERTEREELQQLERQATFNKRRDQLKAAGIRVARYE